MKIKIKEKKEETKTKTREIYWSQLQIKSIWTHTQIK